MAEMRVLSGMTNPLLVPVKARNPTISGPTEMRWPSRTVNLLPGVVTMVDTEDGRIILERYSAKGVVAVDEYPDEDEARIAAKTKRYAFLERAINNFREQNAIKKATQGDILMPRAHHRAWLREMKAIKAEIAQLSTADKELLEAPTQTDGRSMAEIAGEELKSFGIDPQAAPLVPGISDEFVLGMSDVGV